MKIKLVNEGGAYGHLQHPFEDIGLSINDVKEMIMSTVEGAFSPENFVQEKTDGQQLSISWKNGQLIAARNKSHLKNGGENAMTAAQVAELFSGRGDIEIAYNAAMRDLSNALAALSPADKEKYFSEGRKFMSLEVITPITQNTVPYGQSLLVFHGVTEYDEAGNVVGEDKQSARDVANLIKNANAAAQETFYVRGPNDLPIKPFTNAKERAKYYLKKLDIIVKENNLSDNSTIYDYVLARSKNILLDWNKGIESTDADIEGLAKRLGGINKSYTVANIKKDMGELGVAFLEWEKKNAKQIKRSIYAPLENLFLEVGTEMMKNMSSFLSANPTAAADEMRKEIEASIKTIKSTAGEDEVRKLEHELSRIAAVGGLDNIVPTEGITFVFKGKLYKYTGIFAPIHQIRSMLAYR